MKKFNITAFVFFCLTILSSQSLLGMDIEKKKNTLKKHTPKSSQTLEKNPKKQTTKLFSENYSIHDSGHVVQFKPLPWAQLKPDLERLIEETITNPFYEKRTFFYRVNKGDSNNYFLWEEARRNEYKYPLSCSFGLSGYSTVLWIENATKKEEQARFLPYRFFGGKFDESRINPHTFLKLMVQAKFTEEDFERGQYGHQDHILVKPIMLEQTSLSLCVQEVKDAVSNTLKKSLDPYVAIIFELPKKCDFTLANIYYDLFFYLSEFGKFTGIEENDENRLYLFFSNTKRDILNLHGKLSKEGYEGLSSEEAFEEVKLFLQEQSANYAETCHIITGQGKHENSKGTRGILFSSFPKWIKNEEIAPLIEGYIQKKGSYTIFLKKPEECDLTKVDLEPNPFEFIPIYESSSIGNYRRKKPTKGDLEGGRLVCNALRKVANTKDPRLLIKVKVEDFGSVLHEFLRKNDRKLAFEISPIKMESLPGEIRLNLKYTGRSLQGLTIYLNPEKEEEWIEIPSSKKPNTKKLPRELRKNKNSIPQNIPVVHVPKKKGSVKIGTKNSNFVNKKTNPQKSVIQKEKMEDNSSRKECIRTIGKNGKPKFEFKNPHNK